MYRLDRTRKCRISFGVLAIVFLVLSVCGYMGGGYEILEYGFMNEPLPSIVMVSSLFCAGVCFVGFLGLRALEKDIAEWLKIIDRKDK